MGFGLGSGLSPAVITPMGGPLLGASGGDDDQESDEEYETLEVNKLKTVKLGRCGENLTQQVVIDCTAWLGTGSALAGCELMVACARPGENQVYLPEVTAADGVITWDVTDVDTGKAGWGRGEVRAIKDGMVKKSALFRTRIEPGLDEAGATPPAVPDWVVEIRDDVEAAESAAQAAEAAAAAFAPGLVAKEYDAEAGIYRAGEYMTLENMLYKALNDIGTPETFNARKWLHVEAGEEMEALGKGQVTYHNTGADTASGAGGSVAPNLTVETRGNRFTLNGTVASSNTALKLMVCRAIGFASGSYPSGRVTEQKLLEGHTYEMRMRYISGSATHESGTSVGVSARFTKGGGVVAIGTAYPESNIDWQGEHYAVIKYTEADYPLGLSPCIIISRVGADITFTDYCVEVTLYDITAQVAIAQVEHESAILAHEAGEIFWVNDGLYKATAAIAVGDALAEGTNIEATSLAAMIAALAPAPDEGDEEEP